MSLLDIIPGVSEAKLAIGGIAVVAVISGIGVLEYKVYESGYAKAQEKYTTVIETYQKETTDERNRENGIVQESLNNVANRVQELQNHNDELQKELKSAQDEAAKSATASNACIDADGVRRLNNLGQSNHKTHSIAPKL